MKDGILNTTSLRNSQGFTLVELLVTVAIAGFIMSAVYAVQVANMRAVNVEAERVEIQQAQRISLDFILRELRMAGYDKAESDLPTIVDARSNFIYFTADRNDDGDVDDGIVATGANADEHVAFCIYNSNIGRALGYTSGNTNAIGTVGAGEPLAIGHAHASNPSHGVFAPIEELEFFYTLADGTQTTSPGPGQMDDIRRVVVTILARADTPDSRWQDTQLYARPSGAAAWGPYNDAFRRRLLSANIRFRNMGLD